MTASTAFVAAAAPPAFADTVYEITGEWEAGTPTVATSGDVVTGVWRVNINDDAAAPSNEPVDNVTFSVTLDNGVFGELPDACLTDGVDPVSAISEDGATLTCNLGTKDQGTAVVVQTPIEVDGPTESQLSASGTIAGLTADLSPIDIVNEFGMDIRWGTGAANFSRGDGYYELDFEWTLSKARGSDPGPQSITYDLTIGSQQGGAIQGAPQGCTPYSIAPPANGHPWSGGDHPADRMTSFVDSCTITQTGPNTFQLTLSGIDYEPTDPPTLDSAGQRLPVDEVALASGSVWVRVLTTTSGSAELTSSAPTYTSTTGLTAQDDPDNNGQSKAWTTPGTYSSGWGRGYTGSGGTTWDDTYHVAAGTTIGQYMDTAYQLHTERPDADLVGMCAALDTRYVTFHSVQWGNPPGGVDGATVEYYTGADPALDPAGGSYDPSAFYCGGTGSWSTTPPADPSQVRAVRVIMTQGAAEATSLAHITPVVFQTIKPDTPVGTDVWSFFSGIVDLEPADDWWDGTGCILDTPGLRYPCTTGFRDLVRVITATPAVFKSADRSVVTPGQPATYTLTYSANGAGSIPETVDGYQLVDTLPLGVTYVAGSATPEPVLTTNGSGQQVLTWTLDGVPTNTNVALTYQAVADESVEPGATLTNTADATFGGQTKTATAHVTVSTNGYTTIGKAADTPFLPNLAGDGVGAGSWTVTLRSFDPIAQAFTDTIDILPFNGDDRGTEFAGDYVLTGVAAVAGATVYYTTADPASLSDDPGEASNGSAGDVTGNTVGWSTTFAPDATAVRVIGPELAPGASQAFTVQIETDGVEGGDTLVNRAQARDGHTELVMRTSAPITVANYYSASLKKYVQDADGNWRDANTVEDYPTYKPGDTVPYRVVIENTGQGTLTNLTVTDDLFPEGSFTVESLDPGGQEVHEFQIALGEGGPDTVVNTVCGAADVPADSEVPPTINCDPAGLEVEGDPTHTKELVSATPVGGGQWEVVYGIEVSNTSTASTSYSLDDTLHFTEHANIVSAQVTASPDGVTLADPAWDGQGETLIAPDVPLAGNDDDGYAVHRYELTVVADVPLTIPGAGSGDDPTQCGSADGDPDANTAFNNTSAMTDTLGETEEDQACAPIPSIDIDKSVSAGPVPNGDGTWTVTYDIVASNSGTADGEYDLTDRMTADGDLVVESGSVVTTPDGVTASPDWTGLGADQTSPENVIASDVTLPGGETHTYQVEVIIGISGDAGGSPVITPCSALGEDGPGGLSNAAGIEHNDLTDEAEACVTIAYIVVDKAVSSGPTPNGDGTWTVLYDIVAENTGEAAGEYEVTDRLHFGEGITIVSAGVGTAPDGVTLEDGWTGLGAEGDAENVVATGVELTAGGTHTYQVEVVVELDEATIDPSVLECPPPGTGENGGLANSTTVDHNGIVGQDEVCATLPLITMDKTISDGPTPNGDGTWTITYDLVATNSGQADGDYDLSDRLRYGDGIVVESAEVTTAPDGVTTSNGWTGQGADDADENVVVTDVALPAGDSHTYQVQVVVSLDEAVATPETLACPEPGSGETGGLANTGELTHNGETQDDDACAPLPLIDITKSLSGAVAPVDGQDGVYDATYEITVTNRGPGAGGYDLDDTLAPGDGVTVIGIRDVTADAPDPVGTNPDFDGVDDPRIVTGQPIAEASGAPVTHTYAVTVRYSVNLGGIVFPDVDGCTTPGGGTADGALNNVADVTWNGITDSDNECVRPGRPTLDKALVSAEPTGDGTWTVVYDLTVGNVGTEATTYDLDDELLFAPVITVDDVTVTGPQGVELDPAFDGDGNQRIATDVALAGLDDDGYAPHVYRVTVTAQVPLHFEQDDVADDGTGAPACTVPAGSNLTEQGLNNAATLTDETGGTQTDTDCAPVPSIDIAKSVVGGPVAGKDGTWTITYAIKATNTGGAEGAYTLTDRLRFGAGIEVTAAEVTATPKGVTAARSWTGQGGEGDAANVVATEVNLPAGGTHTYQVRVQADVGNGAGSGAALTCPEPGSGKPGGFANTAGIGHNDLTDVADACATPNKPGAPVTPGDPGTPSSSPGSLAITGADIGWIVAGAALLILLGAAALIIAHRRRNAG